MQLSHVSLLAMDAQCNYHPEAMGDWICPASKAHAFFIVVETIHDALGVTGQCHWDAICVPLILYVQMCM